AGPALHFAPHGGSPRLLSSPALAVNGVPRPSRSVRRASTTDASSERSMFSDPENRWPGAPSLRSLQGWDAMLLKPTACSCDIQPCAFQKFVPSWPSKGSRAIPRYAGATGEKVGPNSFVSRILTPKFFDSRILQGLSC